MVLTHVRVLAPVLATAVIAVSAPNASAVGALPPHPLENVRPVAVAGGAIAVRGEFERPGTLTLIAGYGSSESKSWRISCSVATAGAAHCPKLKPSRGARRKVERRGHLKVYVSMTWHEPSGGFSERFPRTIMLRP